MILSCHITLLDPRSFTHSANSDVTLPNYEVPFNPQHRSTCTWKCNYISIRCREAETLGTPEDNNSPPLIIQYRQEQKV